MANNSTRFYGRVGFGLTKETDPGVWKEVITSREYYGDVSRKYNRWETTENANDNVVLNNEISIMADPFAFEHAQYIRWVDWNGNRWKVTSVEMNHPRIKLTFGGVWNGDD